MREISWSRTSTVQQTLVVKNSLLETGSDQEWNVRTLGSGDCGEGGITEGPRDWNSEGRGIEGAFRGE